MSVSHGNDPDVLEGIGDALRVEAERVQSIAGLGASGVAALVESWAGPDLDLFGADWQGAAQQLESASVMLRSVADRAVREAQEQRQGSGEGGGTRDWSGLGPPTADRSLPRPGDETAPADRTLPSIGRDDTATAVPASNSHRGDGHGDSFTFGPTVPQPLLVPINDWDVEDGPTIPFESGHNSVPQGLSFDPVNQEFVYTFYAKGDTHRGEIVFVNVDGDITSRVPLRGIDHYGGVTVVGDHTYVSGGGKLQVYRTEDLRDPETALAEPLLPGMDPVEYTPPPKPINFEEGTPLEEEYADGVPVDASSTVTSYKDNLFVSDFNQDGPSKMYRYEIGPDGRPIPTGDSYDVPPKTQGVSFDDDGNAYFSTSYGRYADSRMVVVSAEQMNNGGWDGDHPDYEMPKMAEGSVIVDGKHYQLYESGSSAYGAHGPDFLGDWVGATDPRDELTVHDLRK